jgi:hypothetical protein
LSLHFCSDVPPCLPWVESLGAAPETWDETGF